MVAENPEHLRQIGVIGNDGARIAECPQVLARVKTEAARLPDRAGRAAAPARAVGLRRILDDHDPGPGGGPAERIHVRHLAVEMDHDHRARPAGDGGLEISRGEQQRLWADVRESRRGPGEDDRFRRSHEGIGGHDDLIARTNP